LGGAERISGSGAGRSLGPRASGAPATQAIGAAARRSRAKEARGRIEARIVLVAGLGRAGPTERQPAGEPPGGLLGPTFAHPLAWASP
jgi:hypothetical protein